MLYDRSEKFRVDDVDFVALREAVIVTSDARWQPVVCELVAAVQNAGVARFDRWVVFGFNDEDDVRAWLRETIKPNFGWSFHPDTSMADYSGEQGADLAKLERCVDEAFDCALEHGFDLYGLCVEELVNPDMNVIHNPDGTTDLVPKTKEG